MQACGKNNYITIFSIKHLKIFADQAKLSEVGNATLGLLCGWVDIVRGGHCYSRTSLLIRQNCQRWALLLQDFFVVGSILSEVGIVTLGLIFGSLKIVRGGHCYSRTPLRLGQYCQRWASIHQDFLRIGPYCQSWAFLL